MTGHWAEQGAAGQGQIPQHGCQPYAWFFLQTSAEASAISVAFAWAASPGHGAKMDLEFRVGAKNEH